jgi:cytoskeletal protein CcmA (bactofilin family)
MGLFGKPGDVKPASSPQEPVRPPAAPPPVPGAPFDPRNACVIGPKTVIKGELRSEEDVVVEGSVEGLIHSSRDVRIGQGGSVKATVEGQTVVVSGEIVGDCSAVVRVELQSSGRLTGNIRAPKIVIAEGAMFKGNSDMSGRKDERKDKAAV